MHWKNGPGWQTISSRHWLYPTLRSQEAKPAQAGQIKYYRRCDDLLPEYNHIVVVVLFSERPDEKGQYVANNYVTNVWAVYMYSQG